MKFQHLRQTLQGPESGNCFPTCISMITGIPLEEIPNFCAHKNKGWWGDAARWLLTRGWIGIYIDGDAWNKNLVCLYAVYKSGIPIIVGGKSPRFDCGHAVVFKDRKQYDPHPDDLGIDDSFQDAMILFPAAAFEGDTD